MPGKPKLYAHQVKILKYVKVGNAWRFANVVESSGRMVRDHVLIAGRDEHHSEGSYYLEWYERGKRHRKTVADFATAAEEARLKAIGVEALKAGVMSRPLPPATINPNSVRWPGPAECKLHLRLSVLKNHIGQIGVICKADGGPVPIPGLLRVFSLTIWLFVYGHCKGSQWDDWDSLEQGLREFSLKSMKDVQTYREKPFFTCYLDHL